VTGKMSRKGFFATLAAAIGGAGAATDAKAVGGVDRYAVVPGLEPTQPIMCSSITVQNINPQEIARQVAASLRQQGFTL